MSTFSQIRASVKSAPCACQARDECALAELEDAGHPDTWPSSCILDTWELGPDCNADPEPSAEDQAELLEWSDETTARDYLDRSATLGLAELVEHQAAFYRAWPVAAGEMIAKALDELCLKIRMTQAETPADYEARIEVLDGEIRDQWMDAGRLSATAPPY